MEVHSDGPCTHRGLRLTSEEVPGIPRRVRPSRVELQLWSPVSIGSSLGSARRQQDAQLEPFLCFAALPFEQGRLLLFDSISSLNSAAKTWRPGTWLPGPCSSRCDKVVALVLVNARSFDGVCEWVWWPDLCAEPPTWRHAWHGMA